jgi:hypothetical protein
MREPKNCKQGIHSISGTVRAVVKPAVAATSTSAMVALALLLVCAFWGETANAACNPRGKLPVLVSNWTKFLQEGLPPSSAPPASGQGTDPSIVGMWHVFMVADGQPFDEGYEQWHSDGTEIFNDIAPPQAANGSGAVCLGVYEKSGPGTYKLHHIGWIFDADANLAGRVVVTQTVTMDAGGSSYHGTFNFKQYDLSENVVFEASGTISATRVTVT